MIDGRLRRAANQLSAGVSTVSNEVLARTGLADRLREWRHLESADVPPTTATHEIAIAGIELAGAGLAAVAGLSGMARLPAGIPATVTALSNVPLVRGVLRSRLGEARAESLFALTDSCVSALAGHPVGLAVNALHRWQRILEAKARDHSLVRHGVALTSPVTVPRRPVPLPDGPVERYAVGSATAGLASTGAALLAGGGGFSAAAMSAASPKPARLTKESFASRVGRALARHDVVVLDPRALRRLDRIDTVVVAEDLLWADEMRGPYAEALIAAAAEVGEVFVAGDRVPDGLPVNGTLPTGDELLDSIRDLQLAGHGVMLMAAYGDRALAGADCGVAVGIGQSTQERAGHLVCALGLAGAIRVLAAVPAARKAAHSGVVVAGYGAAAVSLLGLASNGARGHRTALLASNVAALAGIAVGVWHADPVLALPEPQPVDLRPWHAIPASGVLDELGTTGAGLSTADAEERRLPQPPDASDDGLRHAVAEELANPLTPALTAGAGLAAAVGSAVDAVLIGGVLGVNALVGGVQRLGTNRAVRRLAERAAVPVHLRRLEESLLASTEDLVPGDIIELTAGDAVPADARVIEADGLELDEASLTGESLPVAKDPEPCEADQPQDRTSMVYDGTAVAAGQGLVAVVAAGEQTEARRAARFAAPPKSGGVQARLAELTRSTVPVSMGAGAVLLGVNLLRGKPFSEALAPAVSLAVASVPEGLPSVATVAQLAAARRLSSRGVLVRNPNALESLGRVTALCFDKTGTLTEGKLRFRDVSNGDLQPVLAAALRASPARNGEARLPHATDEAVVSGAEEHGIAVTDGLSGWELVEQLPFEPGRGFHAVIGTSGGESILSVKGAPEWLLPRCSSPDGERAALIREAERLAEKGYRVLAVAEGPAGADLSPENLTGLRFLGFVALADRVRPTAAGAITTLRKAGVRVVIMTGDHPGTARAVAEELGIAEGESLTGTELDRLSDDELITRLPAITLFARVSPAQKVRVTRLLRAAGEVVALTGDGANDAPAIRSADVGIAVGKRATPAAQSAADIVVTDNRIETVVDAVVEGRVLWASVRDAIAMLLGGNLGEIAFTVGAGLFGVTALNTRQILLVNMLTDVAPAIVLAARPPAGLTPEALLDEGPDSSLGTALTRDIQLRAAATASAAAAAWLLGRFTGTRSRAATMALVAVVSAQLGQTLVTGRFDAWVTGACVLSLAVLAFAVQVPGLSQLLGCRPIGPFGWLLAIAAAAAGTYAAWLVRR